MRDHTSVKGKLLRHKSASTVEMICLQSDVFFIIMVKKDFEQLSFDYYFWRQKLRVYAVPQRTVKNTASDT